MQQYLALVAACHEWHPPLGQDAAGTGSNGWLPACGRMGGTGHDGRLGPKRKKSKWKSLKSI